MSFLQVPPDQDALTTLENCETKLIEIMQSIQLMQENRLKVLTGKDGSSNVVAGAGVHPAGSSMPPKSTQMAGGGHKGALPPPSDNVSGGGAIQAHLGLPNSSALHLQQQVS